MKKPKIAVLTLNWNGSQHLRYFLKSVSQLNYPNFFTVVVDNGSSDDSVTFVSSEYPEFIIIENGANIGYSKGFNKGIEYAMENGAEYILITNNDVVLDKNILSEGISLFNVSAKTGYMSGKIFNLGQDNVFQYAGGRQSSANGIGPNRGLGEKDVGQYETVEEFEFMDDVCALVSSTMVQEIGGYDEDFFFDFEETEWNIRIRNNGYRIVYNPKMVAWHRVHGSTGGNRNSALPEYYHWRGKLLFYYKTLKDYDFLKYSIKFCFLYVPVHWIILIRKRKTFLIFHNFLALISGLKRIVELKSK